MKLKFALPVLFILSLLQGALAGVARVRSGAAGWVDWAITLAFVVIVYLWYRHDSRERRYPGSALLGGGVILVSFIAVPVYLYRSRPSGQRAKPMLAFFGLLILSVVVSGVAAELAAKFAASS
ncbi:hypothetical protein [Roseateles sp.]|uniref:hypothetical protein n=1 Tax=Roseateles sp. TaxID=1971397 RepID=UPI0031E2B794